MLDVVLQNLRQSIRILIKKPAFATSVVLILALGIGAATSIFSVVEAVLIRPLPFSEPDRIVVLWENNLSKGVTQDFVSPPNYIDWRNQTQSFEQMEAFDSINFTVTSQDEPEIVTASRVSAGLFQLLGVRPVQGRAFLAEDEQPGRDQVVVISQDFWERRLGSDKNVLDKSLMLDNKTYNIIGVMGRGFEFPERLTPEGLKPQQKADLWAPLSLDANQRLIRGGRYLGVVARLRSGVTLIQARTEMNAIGADLGEKHPENRNYGVAMTLLRDQIVGKLKSGLVILFGAVLLLLAITCVNVANLMFVRVAARQREVAIRFALGCTRNRLIGQMLTESLLLAILGGAAGVIAAYWGVSVLITSIPEGIPRVGDIGVNPRVLGFSLAVSLLTGLACGLAPALQSSKTDVNQHLKESGRSLNESRGENRARRVLVVSEIALSMVMLIVSGLMIKSFFRLVTTNPGFNPENILAMRVALPQFKNAQGYQRTAFFRELRSRIQSLPGVVSVGMTTNLPLGGTSMSFGFSVEKRQAVSGENRSAQYHAVDTDYFGTMGIRILDGRSFTEQDSENAPGVVIINETLARRFLPDESPLGQRLKLTFGNGAPREVVGVVEDIKHSGLDSIYQSEVYVPYLQDPWPFMTLVARVNSGGGLASAMKGAVWSLDKDQPIEGIRTGNQLLYNSVSRPQFYARLLGVFAVLAMALAVVGLYGVVSYSITRRTHEIGLRIALGAQRRHVLTRVVGQGMTLALSGILIGLAASLGITRVLSNLLYGVSTTDSAVFLVIPILLVGVAAIASYIPARRAAKVDPMVALQCE